jgi:hypothetical protein
MPPKASRQTRESRAIKAARCSLWVPTRHGRHPCGQMVMVLSAAMIAADSVRVA